jgi:hypothetical protein
MRLIHRSLPTLCLLICFSFVLSCTKKSESPAGKVAGTYKGTVRIDATRYSDYIIKIDFVAKDKIRASCESTPAAFSTFEVNVSSVNNVITTQQTRNVDLKYYVEAQQLMLTVDYQTYMGVRQ